MQLIPLEELQKVLRKHFPTYGKSVIFGFIQEIESLNTIDHIAEIDKMIEELKITNGDSSNPFESFDKGRLNALQELKSRLTSK